MRNACIASAVIVVAVFGPWTVQGQGQDLPPQIYSMDFYISRYIGDPDFSFDREMKYFFDFYGYYWELGFWEAWVPFDPNTEVAQELDAIIVIMVVTDEDFADPNAAGQETKLFYRVDAWGSPGPPEAPPLPGVTDGKFLKYEVFDRVTPPPDNAVYVTYELWVPRILGASVDRLRGLVDYDVWWNIETRVSNVESPEEEEAGQWSSAWFRLRAVRNNRLLEQNPPPFADAGPDQLVLVGSTVRLDGSRSFDGSNVGFDPRDPNVAQKDTLHYTWEWVSGPEPVTPEPDPNELGNSPYALVTLETTTTQDNPFVFRLVVDDGVNSPPSTDTVRIFVVDTLPANRAPAAVILAPDGREVSLAAPLQALVGDVVRLKALAGPDGADPDLNQLSYYWRQTNEVGGDLMADEISTKFQALQGVNAQEVSWKATTAGTYYFRLLVTDPGGLSDSALAAVQVIEASGVAGAASTAGTARERELPDFSADDEPAASGLCGTGSSFALASLPLVMWFLRTGRHGPLARGRGSR